MLLPFLTRVGSPDLVTPANVLAWAYGIGASGREPSSATVGARIACLSSYYRFLIRMNVTASNPCDALERPKSTPGMARGLNVDQVRRLLGIVPDTVAGRRDRALLLRSEVIASPPDTSIPRTAPPITRSRGKGGMRGRRELPRQRTRLCPVDRGHRMESEQAT
jgi:hypothetical protein